MTNTNTQNNRPEIIGRQFTMHTDWLNELPQLHAISGQFDVHSTNVEELNRQIDTEAISSGVAFHGRKERRKADVLEETGEMVVDSLAKILANSDRASWKSVGETQVDLMGIKGHQTADFMNRQIVEEALVQADSVLLIRENSQELVDDLSSGLEGNVVAQYDLLKTLVQDTSVGVGSDVAEGHDRPASQALFGAILVAGEGTPAGVDALRSSLESGKFDDHIARDMFDYVNGRDIDSIDKHQLVFRQQLELVKKAPLVMNAGEMTHYEAVEFLNQNKDLWPKQMLHIVTEERRTFLQDFDRKTAIIRDRFDFALPSSPSESARLFETAKNEFLGAIAATRKRMLGGQRDPQLPRAVQVRAEIRERMERNGNRSNGRDSEKPQTVEKLREPRRLEFIDRSGNVIDQDSEEFKEAVLQHFTRDQKVAMGPDVDKILEYLAQVDMSKGIVRGIKKYQNKLSYQRNGSNGHNVLKDVWGFKPSEAVGLSLSTKSSRRLRVLFHIEDGAIQVIAVALRPDVPKIESHLGMESGRD